MNRITNALLGQLSVLHVRLFLASGLLALLPLYFGNSIRSLVLRLLGFQIGPSTHIFGMPRILGPRQIEKRLVIGQNCIINYGCSFDLAGRIIIAENVSVGPECMLITGTHRIGTQTNRLGFLDQKDIYIGKGAWLGARVLVLPGVTIGPGVIVGAGAVVTRDLPANTMCAGVPARVIRKLDFEPAIPV